MFLKPTVVQRVSHNLVLAHPPIAFAAACRLVHRFGIRSQGQQLTAARAGLLPKGGFPAQPPHLPPRVNQATSLCCLSRHSPQGDGGCQLVVPYRHGRAPPRPPSGQPYRAGCLAPLGSMRFLFIGSRVSPSLPSHGRFVLHGGLPPCKIPATHPFRSWLQMVVSSFSCLVFLQGTCTPFTSRPCWAHTRRPSERLTRLQFQPT